MIDKLSDSGERAKIVPMRRHQLDVTQRTMTRLEELARLMDCSPEVANTLHTVQQGLAIYPRPMLEPGPDSHNRDLDDV